MATATATAQAIAGNLAISGTPANILLSEFVTVSPPGSVGDWTQPVTIECWGSGAIDSSGGYVRGGGGGAYSRVQVTLDQGATYDMSVCYAGDPGFSRVTGDLGETTLIFASSGLDNVGGAAGDGVGDTKYSGGNGGAAGTGGGGGGGSGGTAANGNNGTNGGVGGGAGGAAVTGGGAGGAGGDAAQNGNAGTAPGGGGGGKGAGGSDSGAGAGGRVVITFTVASAGSLIGSKARAAGGFQELAGGLQ